MTCFQYSIEVQRIHVIYNVLYLTVRPVGECDNHTTIKAAGDEMNPKFQC